MTPSASAVSRSPAPPPGGGRVLAAAVPRRITVQKVASATAGRVPGLELEVVESGATRAGDIVVVEALEEKRVYDQLELTDGGLVHVAPGDVLAGALGARAALRGFVGHCPDMVHAGDVLHVLNLGGVIGVATSANTDYGLPLKVRVLGLAVRGGAVLSIRDGAVPPADALAAPCPTVLVAGTCMASGKTRAAGEIVRGLHGAGYRVGAVKLSGVAALRDTLAMRARGARCAVSFLDAGYPSTAGMDDLAPMAKGLLNVVTDRGVDVIVVEMGDGIVGGYGVESYYRDAELRAAITAHVMCANDLVAAWGACELTRAYGRAIDVMSGPATDNVVGERYVEDELGIAAANARTAGARLAGLVRTYCFPATAAK